MNAKEVEEIHDTLVRRHAPADAAFPTKTPLFEPKDAVGRPFVAFRRHQRRVRRRCARQEKGFGLRTGEGVKGRDQDANRRRSPVTSTVYVAYSLYHISYTVHRMTPQLSSRPCTPLLALPVECRLRGPLSRGKQARKSAYAYCCAKVLIAHTNADSPSGAPFRRRTTPHWSSLGRNTSLPVWDARSRPC